MLLPNNMKSIYRWAAVTECVSVSVVSSHRPAEWVSALLWARLSALCHTSAEDTSSGYGEKANTNRALFKAFNLVVKNETFPYVRTDVQPASRPVWSSWQGLHDRGPGSAERAGWRSGRPRGTASGSLQHYDSALPVHAGTMALLLHFSACENSKRASGQVAFNPGSVTLKSSGFAAGYHAWGEAELLCTAGWSNKGMLPPCEALYWWVCFISATLSHMWADLLAVLSYFVIREHPGLVMLVPTQLLVSFIRSCNK